MPIAVNAIHRVEISLNDVAKKFEENPNWSSLTKNYLEDVILSKLYLIDISVTDMSEVPSFIDSITQENGEDQAPYSEMYFDESGQNQLYTDQPVMPTPPEDARHPGRLRFFMHLFDEHLPLIIDGEEIHVPPVSPMPKFLEALMPYSPPN